MIGAVASVVWWLVGIVAVGWWLWDSSQSVK